MAAVQMDNAPYDQETEQWRIQQFLDQGFDDKQIAVFLVDRVDHHDSARLLKKGCPHNLAVDILAGGELLD